MLGATYNLLILSLFSPVFSNENRPSSPFALHAIQDQYHTYSANEKQHDCIENPSEEEKKEDNLYPNFNQNSTSKNPNFTSIKLTQKCEINSFQA